MTANSMFLLIIVWIDSKQIYGVEGYKLFSFDQSRMGIDFGVGGNEQKPVREKNRISNLTNGWFLSANDLLSQSKILRGS